MRSIIINGLGRCGKSTAAEEISNLTGMEQWPLAKPIKDIMCALFNWDDSRREGAYKEIVLLYPITVESLEAAGMLYNDYGLDQYEAFHDCWEKLIELFDIRYDEQRSQVFCYISPRKAFQLFGTEWGRHIDNDIWLKVAPSSGVIIPDIRFDNEAEWFKSSGAILLSVSRPLFTPLGTEHASEKGIREELIDYKIINDGSREEYIEKVREFVSLNCA
ncbi:deoxynucleotide monophosphate kinase [Vibrio phage JSF12]|uniref:Deoxynucleotide monophosphate kinase n=2 Tax=Jesfedecavirus TaxID=2560156 RepID=A0A2D0YLL3_9CAUD|nr:deoxynucleotide monophosphate kinase [Vibrio phage JSF10]YP_009794737.1 deoxynucleotide monophosphate kinase [Vibrio phage JSF12]ASV43376.1 deoxynucleotide monophosphate kinase [Vibrio phage JSF10]ASV43572.1 deoxynucleotide monophosphate kinase [Vibrio phage JSF12]